LIATSAVGSLDRHSLQHSHHVTGQFGWVSVSRKIVFPLRALKTTPQRNFAGGAAPGCFLPNRPSRVADRQRTRSNRFQQFKTTDFSEYQDYAGGNHRKNMMQSVEASLKRLQTDYVDL
jgi:hypothetical protein